MKKSIAIPRFLLLNQQSNGYEVPFFEEGDGIPKIIHQTYYSKDLPPKIEENIAALKAMNPDWEYKLYDDDDIEKFIERYYGIGFLHYYHRINPCYGAARADFFRYLLMYRQGGVYLDIKSSASRPLDQIILPGDRLILCHWGAGLPDAGRHPWDFKQRLEEGEFQQWHIICAPGHPYIRQVIQCVMWNIDHYIPSMHGAGLYGVLRVTGPIAYTLAILPLLSANKHRLVASHEDIGLVYSIYNVSHNVLIFKHNYKILVEPVIRVSFVSNLLSYLYGCFDRVRRVGRVLQRPGGM